MRDIKFRGKRVDNKEWVYGYYHQVTKGAFLDPIQNASVITTYKVLDNGEIILTGAYNVIPETVGQYTGLKDKNGAEIYEGDVVKYQFDNDDCPFPNKRTDKIIGKIFYSDFRASFSVTAGKILSSMMNNDLYKYVQNGNRVEIISNIHDNPELLEVE